MKTITLKENFTADELLKQAGDEEVVVMRNGHPVAFLHAVRRRRPELVCL